MAAGTGISELEALMELLQLEKQEDFEQYRQLIERMPLPERKAKGYCWHPVEVVRKGFTLGDRAYVVVEKGGNPKDEHQFRSGKTVRLFTLQGGAQRPERSGVIYWVDKNRMHIILNARDLPDWVTLGQVGVDLLFDETTYQEMERALRQVIDARQGRLAELRDILLGVKDHQFLAAAEGMPAVISTLNASQQAAVARIVACQQVAVVHGPPGTGKTTTLVQAVKLLCTTENTVLVTAPSNTAVDLLTERLADEGLEVVRVGNISRVDASIVSHTLEMRLSKHPDSKHIKKVKLQAAQARRQAQRYRRRFGREQYDERRRLYEEARELSHWANQLEDRLIEQILDGAQVITCTLVGAAHKVLEKRRFRTVVIDEAAQALEPATWIPILRASRVILTGDPFQLPPTVKSVTAQKRGLGVTLIEKALQRLKENSLLDIQYRMHETIMGFSNQQFYQGRLRAADLVRRHTLDINPPAPLEFVDTAGCGFEEKVQEQYQSRYNPEEFHILCEHLYLLIEAFGGKDLPSIALISPYREQVHHMQQLAESDPRLADLPLTINTIDGFQGQERDVVYISLVRSNPKAEIGFLSDYRRMNVAMTRARKKLVVVGDSATIGGDMFYQTFLEYCEQHGEYRTAWEFIR